MTFQLPELPYDYGVANILHSLLQKALTNVCKYAEVRAVHIQLSFTPEKACFTTEVNRNGLRLARQLTGFRLQGMQERVAALKGKFQIENEPNASCHTIVKLP